MHIQKFALPLLLVSICSLAKAYDPADKVIVKPGNMPIIFSVPHDGDESLGWISPRSKGATVRDADTRELAEKTADLLEKKTGKRPYLVIAKFSRKFLDVNRKEEDAQESAEAIPAYHHYHEQLAGFVTEVSSKYSGNALLIDIHGQSDDPGTIFRGSRNGTTTKRLLKRAGNVALQGPTSITGQLQSKSYQVFPAIDATDLKEDKRFNGGYIISAHGSNNATGIDAIQLEFGKRTRENASLASDFADAIIAFQNKFLTEAPASN
ncbi:hypothetical protein GCM10027046_20190 [Uliginosibacterium flavum]|uniref:N-formylglutamate amidohydrolase n=1 Tax=Uliginosibacterium flavum TaxID=1396831 RepID=A0ABV2TH22_9RHOO